LPIAVAVKPPHIGCNGAAGHGKASLRYPAGETRVNLEPFPVFAFTVTGFQTAAELPWSCTPL
jgi:hypothetical protein